MSAPRTLVITTMRDEGPHLLEWVAHCRALGAGLLVYSNDCSDGTDALLDLLAGEGVLAHERNRVPEGKTPQWTALKAARDHPATGGADWIAVLDCDEFVNLRAPLASFADLVEAAGPADAILLPWRLFGHSGHVSRPETPTIAAYTRAAAEAALFPAATGLFKTLYRREGPFRAPGVHRPRQTGQPRWRDGSGRPLAQDFAADESRIVLPGGAAASALVQLNHYAVRSAEDFLSKSARGLPNHTDRAIDLAYWVDRNFNEVEDTSIARLAPATLAELERLRGLPGVARAEQAALAHHRRAFRQRMQDPEAVLHFARLLLAAGSRTPPEALARQLAGLHARAATGA